MAEVLILIGADEMDGTLVKYVPMTVGEANDVAAHFENNQIEGRRVWLSS